MLEFLQRRLVGRGAGGDHNRADVQFVAIVHRAWKFLRRRRWFHVVFRKVSHAGLDDLRSISSPRDRDAARSAGAI